MFTVHLPCTRMSRCTVFSCLIRRKQTARPSFRPRSRISHGGIRDLSLRNLAASLDLAPNAIYRYFSDRSALEAALANEAARQLELALRKAADGCEPVTTIREMSSAYIKFARDNRHLYEAMMSLHAPGTMRPPTKASGRSLSSRCNELPGRTELRRRLSRFGRFYMEPWR
jgi:AcrR family transcriptional regulator